MTCAIATIQPSRLQGRVHVSGAKNSVLKLQAASLLTSETVELANVPSEILDYRIHNEMLVQLGKRVVPTADGIRIEEIRALEPVLAWSGRSIRNTLLILGCLLTRVGRGKVPLPGGCRLGERKFDLHVMVMEKLGARVWGEDDGATLCAEAEDGLTGTDVELAIRSTGATENAILMGCLARGTTRIWNPHVRPEILDMVSMLRKMGAKIEVRGQESIAVHGEDALGGTNHTVIPDNLEALTFLVAAAITDGEVEITDFPFRHLEVPLIHLSASGLRYFRENQGNDLLVRGGTVYPLDVATGPYPGINSDMQPVLAAYALRARGESHIVDLRFAGRYQYAEELKRFGADLDVRGDTLVIRGGRPLVGTEVAATDLRGGAAAMLCGLVAQGDTRVVNFEQVLRGYDRVAEKLRALGGRIEVQGAGHEDSARSGGGTA